MKSKGQKGRKKKYYPLTNLRSNPYLVLSEVTHFATKVINEQLGDDVKSDWGDQLLQFINVSKKDEFTERDIYGTLISKYKTGYDIIEQLLEQIVDYVSNLTGAKLLIDWESELEKHKENVKKEMQKNKKSQTSYTYRGSKQKHSNVTRLDDDDEWIRQNLI